MIQKTDYCLIVGAGSIGERYIRNLCALGYINIVVLRTRNLPFRDIGPATVNIITSWEEVEQFKPVAAFICNPTALHLNSAMECVTRGIHVLVEKPLSHTVAGLDTLGHAAIENSVLVHVGYMMRHHPLLKRVYEMVSSNEWGNLIQLQSHWGEYLPDWHPWEDYRTSYAAKRDLGGGVALTLSHDLDLACWIAGGELTESKRIFNFSSSLEVDVESGADFLLRFDTGVTANVHLNFFQRSKERWYKYLFDRAVVFIDFFRNEMIIRDGQGERTERLNHFDRNDLFLDQIQYFFTSLNRPEKSAVSIAESKQIINLCAHE
ncbi:MAG: Gfo/Idh/MocA family oxidoreductase [Cyclobacteriaceae bacterium]|nr:Gfo/Idh/MocA family oxidoreductase [Cyclobacteriaceae bacterium]